VKIAAAALGDVQYRRAFRAGEARNEFADALGSEFTR